MKKTHLLKHRATAQQLIAAGLVAVNNQAAKPAKECKVGDRLLIQLPQREILVEILALPEQNLSAQAGAAYYKILSEKAVTAASLLKNDH